MKIILLSFLIILTELTFACECPFEKLSTKQKKEAESSDCIFIGEVIEINESDNTFKIRVIESLDGGDSKGNTYIGKNSDFCHPLVREKGKWIVYGNNDGEFLRLNSCGISRSFEKPTGIFEIIPAPEMASSYDEYLKQEKKGIFKEWREENKKQAIIELKKEIIALRKRRDE